MSFTPIFLALFTGFLMIHTAAVVSSPQNFTSGPPYGQTNWTVENSSATSTLPINPTTYVTYTLKTGGIDITNSDIRLKSDSYTAVQTSDAGAQDSCTSGGCVMPAGFNAGTPTSTAVSSTEGERC